MKKFIAGFLSAMIICSGCTAALAATGSQSLRAVYKNIKVVVDNKTVALKDSAGNTIEPFIVNGTTYLPVRAVAQALGTSISWDGSTNTVYVGEHSSASGTSATPSGTVLYNENGIKLTYMGAERTNDMYINGTQQMSGTMVTIKIDNNSKGKYIIQSYDGALDGVDADNDCNFYSEVQAGMTSYAHMYIFDDYLPKYYLSSVSKVSFKITAIPYDRFYSDDFDYYAPTFRSDTMTINL